MNNLSQHRGQSPNSGNVSQNRGQSPNSGNISIEIVLNGAARQVPEGQTLHGLIGELALHGQALALAVNRDVVPRQRWPEITLQAQDRVDIVRAIGGG